MTQSHLIVKEEGICIYRVPVKPKESDFTKRGLNIVSFHTEEFSAALAKWYRERDAAPDSAILCEDQKWARKYICDHYTYLEKIGSIYPVPGIEFEVIEVNIKWPKPPSSPADIKTVARLIEHTADKESPEIDKEKYLLINVFADNGEHSHWALIERSTGIKVWSEDPEECKAQGYPVKP